MRIEIQCPRSIKASELCHIRAILFNDSYEPVELLRNAFVGPNVNAAHQPEAVEATFGGSDEALTLQPFTFYGRERSYSGLPPGEVEVTAYYRPTEGQEVMSALDSLHVEKD